MVENGFAEKVCSLYVNNMHLIVMLIPYIERELEKGRKIVTILEDDLEGEVKTLINKVHLPKRKKERLCKINWKKNILPWGKMSELKNKIVLVNGSFEFVKKVNECLGSGVYRVINCFEIKTFEKNSREILENHNKILNTLGEKDISEMFHKNFNKNSILTK